jgi:transcriptional regulator with XRE-family HTH domain
MATLGTRIRKLREAQKFTQKHLAKLLDVSLASLSYYECDRRQPTLETLIRMATIFGVTTDYLLLGDQALGSALEKDLNPLLQILRELSPAEQALTVRVLRALVLRETPEEPNSVE